MKHVCPNPLCSVEVEWDSDSAHLPLVTIVDRHGITWHARELHRCQVYQSPHSRCRGCAKEIRWATLPTGKKVPLDPQPVLALLAEGHVELGRVNHFATCPKAESFRRARS